MLNTRLVVPGLLLVLFAVLPHLAVASDPPSRDEIIARLRHQEGLVRSMEAEFETLHFGTPRDMIPRIKEHYQRVGRPDRWERGVFDDAVSANNSTSRWWRKNLKEREERHFHSPTPTAPTKQTTAFDGQLVRRLYDRHEDVAGDIYTAKSGYWNSLPRLNPMSFVYEDAGLAHSERAARAKRFLVDKIKLDGKSHTRITLAITSTKLVLYFDPDWRLVQQDHISFNPVEQKEAIYSRVFLKDYRPYQDASGETIWFPHQAIVHHHTGSMPEGSLIVSRTKTVTVKSIRFNVDIPDDKFVLQMPKGVPIRIGRDVPASAIPEGVERYVPGTSRPPDPPPQPKMGGVLWTSVGIGGVLVLCGGCFILLRGRGKGKQLAEGSREMVALK